jgi:predicted transcriptional regulator
MRTIVDIPDEDVALLDSLAEQQEQSRAAAIRDAIRAYISQKSSNDWIQRGAGYWKDRTDIGDSVEYQRALRDDRNAHDQI